MLSTTRDKGVHRRRRRRMRDKLACSVSCPKTIGGPETLIRFVLGTPERLLCEFRALILSYRNRGDRVRYVPS